ncbi:MAG: hypothetical protein J1E37_01855, partial [Prevotella sp.]|nr:hypothetical protein [Prevotella sp.]
RVYYLGNKRYTANDTQIQVGDEVIVYGKVVNYKGNTPETVQGTAYLYSLNGVTVDTGDEGDTAEPKGTGTVTDPFNVAAAIAKCEEVGTAGSTETYYIRGKVGSITEQFSAQFGNGTFTMVDEGYSAVFTAYRVKYLGNRSWKGGDTQIKVGDEVIVCGKVVNYYGNTPETVQGDSYLYSLNGVTEGGSSSGGEDQGDQGGNSEIIRSVNGTTLTLTNPSVTASTSKVTIDFTALGWTHQQENPSASANDVSVAFSVGDGGTTPKYWNTGNYDEIRVYAKNIFTITGSKPIAKIVATCTQTSYVGNDTMTGTVSGNTWTIINDHTSTSGGTQLRMKSIEITYAQ